MNTNYIMAALAIMFASVGAATASSTSLWGYYGTSTIHQDTSLWTYHTTNTTSRAAIENPWNTIWMPDGTTKTYEPQRYSILIPASKYNPDPWNTVYGGKK